MLIALVDIANLLLSIVTWIIIGQVILSWLFAFNVLNTSSHGVRTFAVAHRPHDRAALPADPAHPAGFRRDRLLAAGDPDPDPGDQEAARRRRHPILRRSDDREADRRKGRRRRRSATRSPRTSRNSARSTGRAPGLAVGAGRRGSGERRLRPLEERATAEAGMVELRAQPARHDQRGRAARSWSTELNADPRVDGILVQLPLPPPDRRHAGHRDASSPARTSTASTR